MMIRWRRLLLHDIGRKGAALVMAVLVWMQVNDAISHPKAVEISFVVLTEQDPKPSAGQIGIVVPPNYLLTSPAPEVEPLSLVFYGPKSELNSFLDSLSATYAPRLDTNQPTPSVQVSPIDFEWSAQGDVETYFEGLLPPGMSLPLDATVSDYREYAVRELTLQFEQERSTLIDLTHGDVQAFRTTGQVASGYVIPPNAITLEPNNVRLVGPSSAVLNHLADVTDGKQPVLAPLAINGRNRPFSIELGLARQLSALGFALDPPTVLVSVDVRFNNTVEFAPRQPSLLGSGPGNTAWTVSEWNPAPWTASFAQQVGDLSLDQGFARDHIMLFVDLAAIPAGVASPHRVRMDWVPIGMTLEQRDDVTNTLLLQPRNEEDWMLTIVLAESPAPAESIGDVEEE